jgi:hypothetical protein
MRSRHITALVAAAVLSLIGCAPSPDNCRSILPLAGDGISACTTPAGTTGCSCLSNGVAVIAEAKRDGITSWSRGRLWVDGRETTENDFSSALALATARKQVQQYSATARGYLDAAAQEAQRLREALQRRAKQK